MCGRYTLSSRAEDIARAFEAELPPAEATDAARAFALPRYNVAPAQPAPVVRATGDGRRLVAAHRFGLVPAWADDPRVGARMINARAETAAEKPAFRAALRQRRCIVPMTGFYEWQKRGSRKQPYFITMQDD
ncbi:MAG: SOS response-associated peptidase, partial [Myxococcales bacterium]|nr:SOS response-associated peptidase [Myxococcales bacterium]